MIRICSLMRSNNIQIILFYSVSFGGATEHAIVYLAIVEFYQCELSVARCSCIRRSFNSGANKSRIVNPLQKNCQHLVSDVAHCLLQAIKRTHLLQYPFRFNSVTHAWEKIYARTFRMIPVVVLLTTGAFARLFK